MISEYRVIWSYNDEDEIVCIGCLNCNTNIVLFWKVLYSENHVKYCAYCGVLWQNLINKHRPSSISKWYWETQKHPTKNLDFLEWCVLAQKNCRNSKNESKKSWKIIGVNDYYFDSESTELYRDTSYQLLLNLENRKEIAHKMKQERKDNNVFGSPLYEKIIFQYS